MEKTKPSKVAPIKNKNVEIVTIKDKETINNKKDEIENIQNQEEHKTQKKQQERKTINNKFAKYQEATFQKMVEILGVTPNDMTTYFKDDVLKDEIKSKMFDKLYDDVVLFYGNNTWKTIKTSISPHLIMIKKVLQFHGYSLIRKIETVQNITTNNTAPKPEIVRTYKYYIVGGV